MLRQDRCFLGHRGGKNMAAVTSLGLGKTMEKKLHSVGIHSAEELTEIGSKQAVFRLKEKYPGLPFRSSYPRSWNEAA